MANFNLLLLPGDGIGPEVMAQAKNVIAWLEANGIAKFKIEEDLVGGAAYEAHGKAISEGAMDKALAADAVLFGAVGGPKWDKVAYDVRPEAGLCGSARTSRCSPICARRSAIRRLPTRRASSANSSTASTS
jgi:3-isopropylmalate dehydrogenase